MDLAERRARVIQVVAGVVVGAALLLAAGQTGLLDLQRLPYVIRGLGSRAPVPSPRGTSGTTDGHPSMSQDYVISLPGGEDQAERYLRATVVIVVDTPEDKQRLVASTAEVREAFIRESVDVAPDDYTGGSGLDRSRRLMRDALRSTHPEISVRGIYFSDFVLR